MISTDISNNSENTDVIDLLASTFKISREIINDDLHYQSIPEWDSLKHVELMGKIEETYGTKIKQEQVLQLTSVAAIKEFCRLVNVDDHADGKISYNQTLNMGAVSNTIHRGLNGVFYDNSSVASIDGNAGKLLYCGISIQELVEKSSYDEIIFLLLNRRLPLADELENLREQLQSYWVLPGKVVDIIKELKDSPPIEVLKISLSILGAESRENNKDFTLQNGIKLIVQVASIIAQYQAIRMNSVLMPTFQEFSHTGNFLIKLLGRVPSSEELRIFDRDMIVHAEHGSNASTFVARIVTGTESDIYSALTAAVAAFAGNLHGGALSAVMDMLQEIKEPENVKEYIAQRKLLGKPIYGFGHRVYRTEDPRARCLRSDAEKLSAIKQDFKWLRILETVVAEMQDYMSYGMNINVDFYACITYYLLGIPADMFVPVFVASRVTGWVAHIFEQAENNILIRPRLNYIGKLEHNYIPLVNR